MKIIFVLFLITLAESLAAQHVLTLRECHERAIGHHPLIRHRELLETSKSYSLDNAAKGYFPQINIGGQATYQSEVTQIPVEMPGVDPLDKDQYRIYGEIAQTLYHGGAVDRRTLVEEAKADVEERELETELYQIKNRVNELFFGILLVREQIRQIRLVRQDITNGISRVEALIRNGTAIQASADVLNAELLSADQRMVEMQATVDSYRHLLALFIDRPVDTTAVLEKPTFKDISSDIVRPELTLFDAQKKSIDAGEGVLIAGRKPRVDLFLQGGYGRPGLNMLENQFDFYYLGGIRFTWQLSGYYTFRRERQIMDLRRQALDVRKETFLFNTRLLMESQEAEVARLLKLIAIDDEIISLRTKVRQTAAVQLEEGVITSRDFVREINAEDQARQNRILHEMQLLLAQANHEFTAGQ